MVFGINRSKTLIYILIFFIILWSGGAATYSIFHAWQIILLPILLIVLSYYNIRVKEVRGVLLFVALSSIIFIQFLKFNDKLIHVILPVFTFVDCMFLALLVRKHFCDVFVNIIVCISTISLAFWIVDLTFGHNLLLSLSKSLPQLGMDNLKNLEVNSATANTLYFYQVNPNDGNLVRNFGPFWEPGLYSIYIIIALSINLFVRKKKLFEKDNLILLLTAISTFSTTCYVALTVVFVGVIFVSLQKPIWKVLFVIFLTIAVSEVSNLEFMSDKISMEFNSDTTYSRFGAIAYHMTLISKSLFVGFGPYIHSNTFFESSPNGWSELALYLGVPAFIYLIYRLYLLSYNMTKGNVRSSVFLILAILIVVFSQTQMHSPFYILLYFLSYYPINEVSK